MVVYTKIPITPSLAEKNPPIIQEDMCKAENVVKTAPLEGVEGGQACLAGIKWLQNVKLPDHHKEQHSNDTPNAGVNPGQGTIRVLLHHLLQG